MRAAAITGMGPVSALGIGTGAFWGALAGGRSGIRRLTRIEVPKHFCSVAAEVEVAPPDMLGREPESRGLQLSRMAARLAWDDAKPIAAPDRVALIVGTSIGNLDLIQAVGQNTLTRQFYPITGFRIFAHNAACEIARELNIRGPLQTVSSGCNSGADAIGLAMDWLELGRADCVLVGGVEAALTPWYFGAMTAARALSRAFNDQPERASRPFAVDRDGNVPGEGAAFMVLERPERAAQRGASVPAVVSGFASRAVGNRPAYDPTRPINDPDSMSRVMSLALEDAGLEAGALSAVSANGSASVFYDALEAHALAAVLGESLGSFRVHSIKGALGQTGAVTPVLQAIAAACSIREGVIPPTLNSENPDPALPALGLSGHARTGIVRHILANTIGFGGFYFASTVFSAPEFGGA